jgi:adenine-specific DNA-methyltransferase
MAKKDYTDLTKEELIELVNKLEGKKKYGLVWDEEKTPEKVVLDCQNKLPILTSVKKNDISTDETEPTHILIEGDNFHSLSVLNYTHSGQIDFIYADPPYNTGARDWKYNNNYVDNTDNFRHSKWLSFMKNRLTLAKSLLADDGIICVTIDDYEMPRLWLLMEEIFGPDNYLGTAAIRINPGGRKSKRKLAAQHEYALFFSVSNDTKVSKIYVAPESKSHSYKKDKNGDWYEERNLRKEGQDSIAKPGAKRYFPIYRNSETGQISSKIKFNQEILPFDTTGQKRIWRRAQEDIDALADKGDIFYKKTKYGDQLYFKFKGGLKGETPKSFWEDAKYSASEHGTAILDEVLGESDLFPFPKSLYAVEDCIRVGTHKKDAKILDFFAGSGTTGQAVLNLNKEDNGSREFILCTNNENKIAEEVTLKRVKNIIKGYKDVQGLGSNLRYLKTGFIANTKNKDQLRLNITKKCTEMLCLKEGIYNLFQETEDWKIFKYGNKYLAVYYDFASSTLEDLKDEMNKLEGEKVLYCFTVNPYGLEIENFDDWENIRLEPIPQKILDVYKRIFKK